MRTEREIRIRFTSLMASAEREREDYERDEFDYPDGEFHAMVLEEKAKTLLWVLNEHDDETP